MRVALNRVGRHEPVGGTPNVDAPSGVLHRAELEPEKGKSEVSLQPFLAFPCEVVGRRVFSRSVREQDHIAALRAEEVALREQEGQRR